MDEKVMSRADVVKRLRSLYYLSFVGLVTPLAALIPQLLNVMSWVSLVVSAVIAAVLFSLGSAGKRYRSAALLAGIAVVCNLLSMFVATSILSSAGGICDLIAIYNEYEGHGDQIRDQDPKQAKRWSNLFVWQICLGLVIALVSTTVLFMSVSMGTVVMLAGMLISVGIALGLQVVYLIYLHRTCQMLESSAA